MKDLKAKLWLSSFISFAVITLVIFLSAGTIDYWQAWVYLGVGAVPGVLVTLSIQKDPILLENRTKFGPTAEKRPIQKSILLSTWPIFMAAFVVPGLDHRFGWSNVPPLLCLAGDMLVLLSMWVAYRIFKENSFGSATVDVTKGQKVISTGPYAIVRNPMYAGAVVYFVGLSLSLGSYWALIPSVLTILVFIWRLFDEEKFLAENLPGYTDYCAEVRWHLIPGIF